MHVKKSNEEVLVATDKIITLRPEYIEFMKKGAARTRRKRIRLCTHKNVNTILQEMFIVHTKDTYVRPHKHLHKVESIFVVEGRADIMVFDNKGRIDRLIRMGAYESGRTFYYRIDHPVYHSMIIKSEYFIFHEVTNGPFNKSETIDAPWAPEEKDILSVKNYLEVLAKEST